jgi:hypothetical protein
MKLQSKSTLGILFALAILLAEVTLVMLVFA